MLENEVIIVDGIKEATYESLIEECVKYAIISLPFTVDRMAIPDEKQRALNIAKGKVAESLFKHFCVANNIDPDFDRCSTPFWTVDNRDFILKDKEWDIKNNFIYCANKLYNGNYTNLPALIPNRFNGDQWTKRNEHLIQNSKGIVYLFTFLKNASLINGLRSKEFLEVVLSNEQQLFLRSLYSKFNGNPQRSSPYNEDWFWNQMSLKGETTYFKLNSRPELIITGYADEESWNNFMDTGPFDRKNNWQTHLAPRWYTKTAKGSCNFLNGTLWTTITNSTTPISSLNSFLSLYPHLLEKINLASIKI